MKQQKQYTVRDAARACGVPYSTLTAAIYDGRLPDAALMLGRSRIFSEAEVEAFRAHFAKRGKSNKTEIMK